ncbi:MAG TPA: hypothetical protein VEZ14_05500, partial [Dehalococcoidia bacterium]|nr:hypothetical protein [Dehalococcoidia bacterium]
WHITGVGTFVPATMTATQTSVSLDSMALTTVGNARNFNLAMGGTPPKTTIQEASTTCAMTASASSPTVALAVATYTDVNGVALVGYGPTFATSAVANMAVGNPTAVTTGAAATSQAVVTMVQTDKSVSGEDTVCGIAAGTPTLSATTTPNELSGLASPFTITRTQAITVTGVPAAIALTANPAAIACDGTATSSVTAKVTDSAGNNVVDNTPVTFSVVALGTANPIQAKTTGGSASSTITPLSGSAAGTTVIVTAGSVQASIRVDCLLPTPTVPAVAPTATPKAGTGGTIVGPNTGTGGYLGQDSSAGFPLWTLIALGLGSVVLVAGGMVTRRVGK